MFSCFKKSNNNTYQKESEFAVSDIFYINNLNKVIAVGNVIEGEFKTSDEVMISIEGKDYKDKIIEIKNMNKPSVVSAQKGENVGLMLDKMDRNILIKGSKIRKA